MGKQINYFMDYESFLKVAQAALDEGCLILKSEHTPEKQTPSADLSVITKNHLNYYFYLPELGELEYKKDNAGNYYVNFGYNDAALSIIEAGFSRKTEDTKGITPNRLYSITGFHKDGEWVARPERLEKVYNKLVRVVKKVAPQTAIEYDAVDLKDGVYGAPYKGVYKDYISSECRKWLEEGYETNMLRYLREKFESYLKETGNSKLI